MHHEPDSLDLDRRAILAMAGEYEVEFSFEEVVACAPDYQLKKPYSADATELVLVIADQPDLISLQHILVLDNGFGREPQIVKHWRQDWRYQPVSLLEFKGHDDWQRRSTTETERAGAWSQTVYQVNDQPRYAGVGAWQHIGDASTWAAESWRPLPRREATKRSDYHVMISSHRHSLTATGWVHEQLNRKVVLDEMGQPEAVLAHEAGVNTYQRSDSEKAQIDFAAGSRYWQETQQYWAAVRSEWAERLAPYELLHIEARVDGEVTTRAVLRLADEYRVGGEAAPQAVEAAARLIEQAAQLAPR